MFTTSFLASCLLGLAAAQTPGKMPEVHPKIQTYECTKSGGCVEQMSAIVLDSGTHWLHQLEDPSQGCGPSNKTVCPDIKTCAKNCIIEGISDYSTYGVTTQGSALHLEMLRADGSVQSPRVYLLDENEEEYQSMKLLNKEFTFDVDASKLPCGMNGALYLSEMEHKGGEGSDNRAGAAYGTGYCDAQCPRGAFINGKANIDGKGACCNEMDIWEANSRATQLTPHTCNHTGVYPCTGAECAFNGVCDKNGCSYNTYSLGDKNFYGRGLTVDTTRNFTVVTQFVADKWHGLSGIKRLYVQDGKVIQQATVNTTSMATGNVITDSYCNATSATRYEALGGNYGMGQALRRGMTLVFSIWWDNGGNMNWLDSSYAGPCNATEGNPSTVLKVEARPAVTFSQMKWGEIDSTYIDYK